MEKLPLDASPKDFERALALITSLRGIKEKIGQFYGAQRTIRGKEPTTLAAIITACETLQKAGFKAWQVKKGDKVVTYSLHNELEKIKALVPYQDNPREIKKRIGSLTVSRGQAYNAIRSTWNPAQQLLYPALQ